MLYRERVSWKDHDNRILMLFYCNQFAFRSFNITLTLLGVLNFQSFDLSVPCCSIMWFFIIIMVLIKVFSGHRKFYWLNPSGVMNKGITTVMNIIKILRKYPLGTSWKSCKIINRSYLPLFRGLKLSLKLKNFVNFSEYPGLCLLYYLVVRPGRYKPGFSLHLYPLSD